MCSGGLLQNFHKSLLACVSVFSSVYRWMVDALVMYLSELQKEEQEWTRRWIFISLPFTVQVTPGLQTATVALPLGSFSCAYLARLAP